MLKEILDTINELPFHTRGYLPYQPYSNASNREAWNGLDEEWKGKTIRLGETYLGYHFPSVLATAYMEFCRTGNRSLYQEQTETRRCALNALVLAECVEGKGRF